MFIYTLRASTIKFFTAVCIALAALITLIVLIPSDSGSVITSAAAGSEAKLVYDKIKTNDDRRAFLAQFGWEASADPEESAEISIPADFDKVFSAYNEVQKKQGLDLSKYKKKDMMRYTYVVTNYPGYSGKVYANLLIYKNRVVGGDICSADRSGFMHGFGGPG